MIVTGRRGGRGRPRCDIDTRGHRDPDPGSPTGAGGEVEAGLGTGGVAVVMPVAGDIRTVAFERNTAALARREIGCQAVERLRLGHTLLTRGLQIWLDGYGPSTGDDLNPRAAAVVLATLPRRPTSPRLLRQLLVGPVLFCAGPDPEANSLALTPAEAAILVYAANTLEHRARRGRRRFRRGPA